MVILLFFCCLHTGLLTFADGTSGLPRNEGRFEGSRLLERKKASEAVRLAKQAAQQARSVHL